MEYEDVLKREALGLPLSEADIDDILDYLCLVGEKRQIHFLWRPYLKDPKDDMVLELAFESGSEYILTYNKKDFREIEKLGIKARTPKEFLQMIGEI